MTKITEHIWGGVLSVAFQCARIVFSVTRTPVRGAAVALWCQGRILLVQKSYRKGWSIPGGMLKKGEAWKEAAVRETLEEVGISLNPTKLSFVAEVHGDLGPCDRSHLFEGQVPGPVKVKIDGREIIDAEFVEPGEALTRELDEHIEKYLRARVD